MPTPGDPTRPLVVGIGASAGGVEALAAVLAPLPADAPFAAVVVLHHDPATNGLLADVLKTAAALPVEDARDGEPIRAGRVYVAPGRGHLSVEGGVFRIAAPNGDGHRATVDHLLHALADDLGDRAVAVILSGSGSDGAHGLKAVADAGGLAVVQDPATAKHAGMPRAALDTGAADHVLPPDAIAAELLAHARHRRTGGDVKQSVADLLPDVCDHLLAATGHNFRHYKTSTLVRRVVRRVQVLRLPDARAYLDRLRDDRAEADRLFDDLLIGVTAFFRDPDAWAALAREVLPGLFAGRPASDPVRVWVPGCATGEEAYTLAMLLLDERAKHADPPAVQVFATDLDEHALAIARLGSYPVGVADELPAGVAERHFGRAGGRLKVGKDVREAVLFSAHNLINDPPFSRLDLISCRNLLIYLGEHLQQKLVSVFHYALKDGGHLLLGPSENVVGHRELFRPVDSKHRLSQRLPTAIRPPGVLAERTGPTPAVRPPNVAPASDTDTYLVMQRITLDEFAPKSVVVNEAGQVVCASGNLEKYLALGAGAFHNNVVRLARDGLRVGLRAALAEAAKVRRKVSHDGLTLRTDAGAQRVMVTVQPMPQLGEGGGLYYVAFQDVGPPLSPGDDGRPPAREEAAALIDQLERELATTRHDLEATVQELEAANEELKSSNEELLSMNEELQSANEELETSKEDVQAANDELGRVNTDLENLLASTGIATLFLAADGTLRRITPAATAVYNLRPADIGRPLSDITHTAVAMPPVPAFADVAAASGSFDATVTLTDGRVFLRRALPYRTADGAAAGVVLTFADVTEQARAADALRASEERVRLAVTAAGVGFWTWDAVTDVALRDAVCDDMFDVPAGVPGSVAMANIVAEDRPAVDASLADAAAGRAPYDIEFRVRRRDGTVRWLAGLGNAVRDADGKVLRLAGVNLDVTARRAAQEALLHQGELTKSITDNATTAIFMTDAAGRCTFANPAAERMTGFAFAELDGRVLHDAVHHTHADGTPYPRAACVLDRAVREGFEVRDHEDTFVRKSGERFPVVCNAQVVTAGGRPVGTVVEIRDVTDERRAAAALRASEERYRSLTEATTAVVWRTDGEGAIVTDSASWAAFTGQTPAEYRGWGWMTAVHPDDRAALADVWRRSLHGGDLYECGYRLRRRDGAYRDVVARGVPIPDGRGGLREWVGTCTDVTDQKRAADALRDSEAHFRTLADTAPVVLWLTDAAGQCTFLSRGWYALTGQANGDGLGLGWTDALHPDDKVAAGAAFLAASAAREPYAHDFRVRRAGGDYRWTHDAGLPRFDAGGAFAGFVGSVADVHDRKLAADALRDADRRKDEFLATLAHELRNPLAPVRTGLQVLRLAEPDSDAAAQTRDIMDRQLTHMVRLVDDLLDVSRITRGTVDLRRERVPLRAVVDTAVEASRPLLDAAGHDLTVTLPAEPVWLDADPTRLAQVLANLLNNAAKYTPDRGHVALDATAEGGTVAVRVTDDGLGIPAEMLPKVFEMFAQVNRTLDRAQGGLGIGLTLVRRLVELHGGTVEAASDGAGQGSTFTVRLPTAAAPTAPTVSPAAVAPPTGLRVLVVDDNRDGAESLALLLSLSGHATQTAHSGPAALAAIRAFAPQVVFLDIGMPGMTGYDVAAVLHADPPEPMPALVALTGWGGEQDKARAKAAGFAAHLTKPVDVTALGPLLAKLVAKA